MSTTWRPTQALLRGDVVACVLVGVALATQNMAAALLAFPSVVVALVSRLSRPSQDAPVSVLIEGDLVRVEGPVPGVVTGGGAA